MSEWIVLWGKSELFEKGLILLQNGQGKAGRESGVPGSHICGRGCEHLDGQDQSRGRDGCIQLLSGVEFIGRSHCLVDLIHVPEGQYDSALRATFKGKKT